MTNHFVIDWKQKCSSNPNQTVFSPGLCWGKIRWPIQSRCTSLRVRITLFRSGHRSERARWRRSRRGCRGNWSPGWATAPLQPQNTTGVHELYIIANTRLIVFWWSQLISESMQWIRDTPWETPKLAAHSDKFHLPLLWQKHGRLAEAYFSLAVGASRKRPRKQISFPKSTLGWGVLKKSRNANTIEGACKTVLFLVHLLKVHWTLSTFYTDCWNLFPESWE